jgi:hypothetical protein
MEVVGWLSYPAGSRAAAAAAEGRLRPWLHAKRPEQTAGMHGWVGERSSL